MQTNPFASEALKESVSFSKIEKSNIKLESYTNALKKFSLLMKDRMTKVLD